MYLLKKKNSQQCTTCTKIDAVFHPFSVDISINRKILLPISYTCITKDLLAFVKISKIRGQIISTGGNEI